MNPTPQPQPQGLTVGQHYRVIWMADNMRKPRESVMKFMGPVGQDYTFDLRPLAGTQRLPKRCVMAIFKTNAPLALPKIYEAEERVL